MSEKISCTFIASLVLVLGLLVMTPWSLSQDSGFAPADRAAFLALLEGKVFLAQEVGEDCLDTVNITAGTLRSYQRTGPNAATVVVSLTPGERCTVELSFTSATAGRYSGTCTGGEDPGRLRGAFRIVGDSGAQDSGFAPADRAAFLALLEGKVFLGRDDEGEEDEEDCFDRAPVTAGTLRSYQRTGPNAATIVVNPTPGERCTVELSFTSAIAGRYSGTCTGGEDPGDLRGAFLIVGDSDLPDSDPPDSDPPDSDPPEVVPPGAQSYTFVPVILTSSGANNAFFTTELTLTNPGTQETTLNYTYTAHRGGGSGTGSDSLPPGRQKIVRDAISYLKSAGVPIPDSGNRIGTLRVDSSGSVSVLARVTTAVPNGAAGLAFPGIPGEAGLHEAVWLCGLRQNRQDRSNVAFQNMGTEGSITLRTTVFSGDPADSSSRVVGEVTLAPGGFHQYSRVLGSVANGFVRVERVSGTAPFYAYGVINDNFNSDGSFVFPVTASSLEGQGRQTLPVIIESRAFQSELTVTNFSQEAKTIKFNFVADAVQAGGNSAGFNLMLQAGEQRIIPNVVNWLREEAFRGIGSAGPTFVGALFATTERLEVDMSGIVIGARTGSPDGRGGQYGLFYNAVPEGAAFTGSAWVYGLQQNAENRTNLALVNTGIDTGEPSVFRLDIYDGETGALVNTVGQIRLAGQRFHQINRILEFAAGTSQGYVQIQKISTNPNPFLAYGVINDGAAPGRRSGDGAYVPAQK